MSRALRTLALTALACLSVASGASASGPAEQLYPIDLRVNANRAEWHAERQFRLDWDWPPIASQGFPVAAFHFQVRDAGGAVVVPATRLTWDEPFVDRVNVPRLPGVYAADVWLEGPGGQLGPTRSAALRFDDVAPAPPRPLVPAGWIAANAAAQVRIERPAAPLPISGIRGYAISVDRDGAPPCAAPDRCTPAETDLDGGIGDDVAALGPLREGTHRVQVVAVSGSGVASAARSAVLRVDATPPRVELLGAPRGWASRPVRLTARATDALSGMEASGPTGSATAIAVDGGVPRSEPGPTTSAVVSGDGIHAVAATARDVAGNGSAGAPAMATVAIDESPPAVSFARGQDPADPERIEATVGDPLSGPSPARGSIALRPAGSRQGWRPLPTAVQAGRLVARWDSDSFPAGSYEFRATGYDVAGNATGSERRAGGARMVLRNPLKSPTRIEAELDRGKAGQGAARQGESVRYGGRLGLSSGAPLAGMPVRVIERFDPGSDPAQRVTVVETGADGSFRIDLASGPSRRIEAAFAGSRLLGRSSSPSERLAVAAGVRLRASTRVARVGGAPVVFRGRILGPGARLPAAGKPVELQFRLGDGRWLEFRTVEADARGRFRYAYAFSDDDSRGVRFQFRAYIRGGDWPYEPAASKAVTVAGR